MESLIEIVQTYGLFAGISCYMIYQQRKDFNGVCRRLAKVENFVQNELMTLNANSLEAIHRSTEAVVENSEIIRENQAMLNKCVCEDKKK